MGALIEQYKIIMGTGKACKIIRHRQGHTSLKLEGIDLRQEENDLNYTQGATFSQASSWGNGRRRHNYNVLKDIWTSI